MQHNQVRKVKLNTKVYFGGHADYEIYSENCIVGLQYTIFSRINTYLVNSCENHVADVLLEIISIRGTLILGNLSLQYNHKEMKNLEK